MKISLVSFFFLVCINFAHAQLIPKMRRADKICIREAVMISSKVGESVWKGISKVPFVVLLVTDSVEFLVNHPNPSPEFKLSEKDELLKADIYYRPRQYPVLFLATFPAVNGVNCIVVGTRENTTKKPTEWIVTLLHEHFHQFQFTSTDYYKEVNELGLSGGDETGMWQLNYPFPYDSSNVVAQYDKYVSALKLAFLNRANSGFDGYFKEYLKERNSFRKILSPKDYSYFSFQLWQEGIAKYTEHKFLAALGKYKPSREAANLPRFVPFNQYATEFIASQIESLKDLKLPIDKRVCIYAIGLAEGLLLDKVEPGWQRNYLNDKFFIERYTEHYR